MKTAKDILYDNLSKYNWGQAEEEEKEILAAMEEYASQKNEELKENTRIQLAGISTAALGYWKESDTIHPDYDTVALRDVAKLYQKYDKLFWENQRNIKPQENNKHP